MAKNKKPRKQYRERSYMKQKLKTMLVFMNWVMGPLEHMINEMETSGCTSCDENGDLLFIDNHEGSCFPMFPFANHLILEVGILFERYKISRLKLNPLITIFRLLENDEAITDKDLESAHQSVSLIRHVLGNATVRDYDEIFEQWEKAHQANRKFVPLTRRVIAL